MESDAKHINCNSFSFKMSVPFVSSVKIVNKTVVNLLLYWPTKNAMEFEKKQRISSLVYLMFYEFYINDLHLYFLSLNHMILVNVVHSSQVIFLESNYNILSLLSPNTETKNICRKETTWNIAFILSTWMSFPEECAGGSESVTPSPTSSSWNGKRTSWASSRDSGR